MWGLWRAGAGSAEPVKKGAETMVLSNKLVALIERNADQLTKRWLDIVRTHENTPTYHTYDEDKLYDRAFSVYSQLGKWLSEASTSEEVKTIYTELGGQRRKEGFKISELLEALLITRQVLWTKVESEGLLDTALHLNQALELNDRISAFFDRCAVYAAQGYESESV
jgi:hypothetical protein